MNLAIDLERKSEQAFAARLKQQPLLARVRMRLNSEESAKVNQDLILAAKRGEGDPPFSGIYKVEVAVSYSMKQRRTVDTLPQFLNVCAAMEQVFNLSSQMADDGLNSVLAAQLSLAVPSFHCYEVAVTGKDDTPEDNKHKCLWTLSIVAMSQNYANALAVNT